ncbi:MAG: hypothetical protein IJO51_05470 [Clostridia bacterium]|nr:hypothetical protein [Clostridia bacterium]
MGKKYPVGKSQRGILFFSVNTFCQEKNQYRHPAVRNGKRHTRDEEAAPFNKIPQSTRALTIYAESGIIF